MEVYLFLGAKLVAVTTLALAAVGGTGRETSIALAADLSDAVGLTSKLSKSGGHHTTAKTKNEVDSRLLLDVVVSKGAAILELLTTEDETLLLSGDTWRSE